MAASGWRRDAEPGVHALVIRADGVLATLHAADRYGDMPMIAVTLTMCVVAASPPTYNLVQLPTLEGNWAWPLAINNAGQVVGRSGVDSGQHACLWQLGIIGDLHVGGSSYSWATGINDAGMIVGEWVSDTPQSLRPVIFSNGSVIDLGTLGGQNAWATAVNNAGSIVGSSFLDEPGENGVLWSSGDIVDLGAVAAGFGTEATGINESGMVILTGNISTNQWRAAIWLNGLMTEIGTLGGLSSHANGLNDEGVVVGGSSTADGVMSAFSWTAERGMNSLGAIPGFDQTYAQDINQAGLIIGGAWSPGNSISLLWWEGEMVNLDELVPNGSPHITAVLAINNADQIVGFADSTPILLTPTDLGDIDGDGMTGIVDFLELLGTWGDCECPADLNHDGTVNHADLMLLLSNWSE